MAKLKKILCTNCKKSMYRSRGRVNENLKLRHNFYCSRKCQSQYKSKRKMLACENCEKLFLRMLKDISLCNYCSRSCAAKINNKKYPKIRAKFKNCATCDKKFKNGVGNLKYCSIKCRWETERKSAQEVLETIRQTAKKLERVPARRELGTINDACIKIFGSWNNAIIAAGLPPHRSHNQRMYKRINTKALDGHLCDSISEAIIDNWLTKNKILHEKDILYPKTNYKADWVISLEGQKIFIEYFGLANDSPRYDRTIQKKKELCKKHKHKLIEIYPEDLYPKVQLNDKLRSICKNLENV